MSYEEHNAEVYKRADGTFEVVCQTKGCRFRIDERDSTFRFTGSTYERARAEADEHSRWRFR